MNKSENKSKVDKCPSTTTYTQPNKVKDLSNHIINQNIVEKNDHVNGIVVNGISGHKATAKKTKKKRINHLAKENKTELNYNHPNNELILNDCTTLQEPNQPELSKNSDETSRKKQDDILTEPVRENVDSNENISTNSSSKFELTDDTQELIGTKNCESDQIKLLEDTESLKKFVYEQAKASCSRIFATPRPENLPESLNSNNDVVEVSRRMEGLDLNEFNECSDSPVKFVQYESELQMPLIMKIIQKDLSEPYSIYTYRYFIHNWPRLCFLAMANDECVGAIVCKLDIHRKVIKRGYIAMLAVDQNYRKQRIGSNLVQMAIKEMMIGNADEVVLETEVTNKPALQLYEKLGFVRDKRLFRYYLNGVDALRLKLWLR